MRIVIGLLLMAVAVVGCVFLAALGAGLAGANPANFLPMLLLFWGIGGPIFFLGVALLAGGSETAGRTQAVCLALGLASVVIAALAAWSL